MPGQSRVRRFMVVAATGAALSVAARPIEAAPFAREEALALSTALSRLNNDDPIGQRDLDLIDKVLNFDDGQREIVAALYMGYRQQLEEHSAAHRNRLKVLYDEARSAADRQAVNARIRTALEKWAMTQAGLKGELLESIRGILTRDQLAHWPIVERDQRRQVFLKDPPRFYAENIDLIELVDGVEIESDQRGVVDRLLHAWAEELDGLLKARSAAQDRWNEEIEEPTAAGHPPEPSEKHAQRERLDQVSRAVRDLNLHSATVIFTQLSTPANVRFRSAFNLAAYPRIFRPTPADTYVDAALQLPDLAAEQTEAIREIKSDFDDRMLVINDQLAAIVRSEEDADPEQAAAKRTAFEQPGGVTIDADGNAIIGNLNGVVSLSVTQRPHARPAEGGGRHRRDQPPPEIPQVIVPGLERADSNSPQGRLEQNKRDLVQQTIDSVFAVLTAEQQAALPRPSEEEMLSPEERMKRVMERAFANAVITHNDDGSITFQLNVAESGSAEK